MDEKFKVSDSYRQSIELEAARESEVVDKIVRESENKVINKFLSLYGSGKLSSKTSPKLDRVEGETSSAVVFDGEVTVNAEVIDSNGTKKTSVSLPVEHNKVALPDDEELQNLVKEAEVVPQKSDIPEEIDQSLNVEADLSQFYLVDDKSDYYRIYHPSLDLGKPLGVISREEYETLNDKEGFFKDAILKQATNPEFANHYSVNFVGAFSEPKITVESEQKTEPVKKEASYEEPEQKEEDKDNLFLARLPDGFEKEKQFSAQKTEADYNRLLNSIANNLVTHLRSLNYDSVKVLSGEYRDNHKTASFSTSVTDNAGEKIVTLDVPVEGESYKLPKRDVISEIVSKTADLKSKISERISEETIDKFQAIDENETWKELETEAALEDGKEEIKKEAGADSGGIQWVGPLDVLNIDKHSALAAGIPEDIEIGDEVELDGFRWKLTSKNKDHLSKEADGGSILTFTKVTHVSENEED